MKVNLHIDQIVLDGADFASARSPEFEGAFVNALEHQLMHQKTGFHNAHLAQLSGPSLDSGSGNTNQLATDVASSVVSTLRARRN